MPAKNMDIVASVNMAPRKGDRSCEMGIWNPAVIWPMSLQYGAVADAHTPAAICAAGGMPGWERKRMILAR